MICSIKSPYSYFKQTLNIANRWDIFGILAAEQIKPHDRNTYTLKQLNEALLKKAGAVGAESPNTKYFSVGLQLLKIRIFFTDICQKMYFSCIADVSAREEEKVRNYGKSGFALTGQMYRFIILVVVWQVIF